MIQDIETFFDFPANFDSLHSSPPSAADCTEEYMLDGKKWIRCTFPDCGKTFRYKSEITRHQVIHFNSRPYPCPYAGCKKSFKRPDGLETHVRTHTKDMPFECTVPGCEQKFTTRASLRYHILKHNDQPSFTCSFEGCDKSFLTQAQLKQHEKSSSYHKKICATKPTEEILPLPKKAGKDGNSFYNNFFETAPRAPEEIQWEMKDLAEEDECGEGEGEGEEENNIEPSNFENVVKYIVDENKILKQNVDLRNKLMSALQENYDLKSQMKKLQNTSGFFPQPEEKQLVTKGEELNFFFDQNDFEIFEFLKEGDNTNF